MNMPEMAIRNASYAVAELHVTNPAPRAMLTTSNNSLGHPYLHAFGVIERPRFRMERPYSPDDAWSLEVDPTGALAADLPACVLPIKAELDAFFGRQLDELSCRLLGALPSGRYMVVRSLRTPEVRASVLLGNELVPAKPNCRTLCDTTLCDGPSYYAALFGANETVAPSMSGILTGIALLSTTGNDHDDATWFFDLHGPAAPPVPTDELSVVVPLDGPLVFDVMLNFRGDNVREIREIREQWSNEDGPTLARWLAGEIDNIGREFP